MSTGRAGIAEDAPITSFVIGWCSPEDVVEPGGRRRNSIDPAVVVRVFSTYRCAALGGFGTSRCTLYIFVAEGLARRLHCPLFAGQERFSTMAMQRQLSRLAHNRSAAILRLSTRPAVSSLSPFHESRGVATSYLEKVAEGEQRWAERAEKLQTGEIPHVWDLLEERGYIKDVAGHPERIKEIMRTKRIGAYVGVDPTADSMHIGHILPMMPLFWLWFHGHPAVTLLGGSTARIGDPTGRLNSRQLLSNSELTKNVTKLHYQLRQLWHNVSMLRQRYGYEDDWAAKQHLLNNSMWLQNLTIYDFIKRLARHTRIGPMLGRDTVKRKLTDGDGMSLGEFMYPMLQGWDFWHLYSKLGVQMQIGGSDQFGNIIAGIETLKTIRETEEAPHAKTPPAWHQEPIGMTVPLLTDSAGVKFGKSAGNAVWLDSFKTTPFELYGYFMRRSDEEIERLLKLYTFMPLRNIQQIMEFHMADPSKRLAQHHLAFEVLSLVHGSQKALEEAQQHALRFGGSLPEGFGGTIIKEPTQSSGIFTPNTRPRIDIQLPRSVMNLSPAKILWAAGLVNSGSEGQRLVAAQGAYVAGSPGQMRGLVPGNLTWTPMKMWFPKETSKFLLDDSVLVLRKGKNNVRVIEIVNDEEWQASGQTYPGEEFTGRLRLMKEELRKEAEAKGVEISERDLRAMVGAKLKEKTLTVANNPDIVLPNKEERRQMNVKLNHKQRRMLARSKNNTAGETSEEVLGAEDAQDGEKGKGDKDERP
ncbi:Tyrosine--tRNA ligase [Paramyrothecium foliicola]|nr:Tyrosine--tRNA ligase [Paramyrothecium foliicola]